MDEQRKKAFDFAQSLTTQLITLATGVIAITLTFAKDFIGGATGSVKVLLAIGWLLFLLSIVAGLLTLSSLIASLEDGQTPQASTPSQPGQVSTGAPPAALPPSIWSEQTQQSGVVQFILFGAAILITVIAGAIAL
jgi:hypothetical protein